MVATIPLWIMQSHSQAMKYWPPLSRQSVDVMKQGVKPATWQEPISVVHFDSHLDMTDMRDTHCRASIDKGRCWDGVWKKAQTSMSDSSKARETRPELLRLAAEKVFLSDFITASILVGNVDNVIWVRSDFKGNGQYHGPDPGRYLVSLMQAGADTCFNLLKTFEYFESPKVINTEANTFATCDVKGIRKGKGNLKEVQFQLTVITMEQFLEQLRASKGDVKRLAAKLEKTPETSKLGMGVKPQGGVLKVSKTEGGCTQMWNDKNPESAIEVGDRVVDVNGMKDVTEMLNQLKSSSSLQLTFERGDEGRLLSRVLHRGLPTPKQRDWILDLDLDVFATNDPSFGLFAQNNFTDAFMREVTFLFDTAHVCTNKRRGFDSGFDASGLVKLRESEFCGCLSDDGRGDYTDKAMRHAVRILNVVADMPSRFSEELQSAPTLLSKSDLVHAPLKKMDPTCDLGKDYAARLFDLLANLPADKAKVWQDLFRKIAGEKYSAFDTMRVLFQGYVGKSVHQDSPAETERHFGYFEELLGHMLPGDQHLPRVITMCRSTADEKFLPSRLWPGVERRAIKALKKAFAPFAGLDLGYAAEASPLEAEPHEARNEL